MDKTFEEKWESSDVQNIMNKVANRYRTAIDFDDIESIKMQTLWRCIDRYDPDKGTKFTSYLYQQLSFAFKNKLILFIFNFSNHFVIRGKQHFDFFKLINFRYFCIKITF